ncbi:33073_t:CDS:2, partial [Gigaspora margarita]
TLSTSHQVSSSNQYIQTSSSSDQVIQVSLRHKEIKPFSSYKTFDQLDQNFNMNIERIDELPKFNIEIMKVIGKIDNCSNEAEKCEFISAILIGIVSTFDKHDKIRMHKEYSLSGVNDKGRLDFTITQDKNILCTIEAKSNNIEHGFCQNLVQLKSACEENRKRKHGQLDHVYGAVTTGESADDVLKEDVRSLFRFFEP